ncbi:MAG: hypothetical protein IT461_08440 [Planctomycetes bacterium]|jgi:hypothetical protein|nr:hypothetical protein [Planctomycetota bacterium]
MKRFALMLAVCVGFFALSGCTFFQDDVYYAMDGVNGDEYVKVDNAIRDALVAKFGKENVFRLDGHEQEFERWQYISPVVNRGLDKQRMRVDAYPRKNQDGFFEPLIIARWEFYSASSYESRAGGHTLHGGRAWSEMSRDSKLETELMNAADANMRKSSKGGAASGK